MSRPTRGHEGFLPVRGCHPLWPDFPDGSGSYLAATGLVRVRSPLLTESRLMSFPPGTEMFQFPGFASATYGFSDGYSLRSGLPHSEIPGSKPARGSPRLFAACHVLHRLLAPRHPPDALAFLDPHQRQPHPHLTARCTAPGEEKAAAGLPGGNSSDNYHKSLVAPGCRRRPGTKHTHANDAPCPQTERPKKGRDARLAGARHARRTRGIAPPCPHGRAPHHHLTMSKQHDPPPGPPCAGEAVRAAWWAWADLNGRPHAYQACALTS